METIDPTNTLTPCLKNPSFPSANFYDRVLFPWLKSDSNEVNPSIRLFAA